MTDTKTRNERWLAMDKSALVMECQDLQLQVDVQKAEISGWKKAATEFSRNSDFYRDTLRAVGDLFGVAARTADDGSVRSDVLALKVKELVQGLQQQLTEAINNEAYESGLASSRTLELADSQADRLRLLKLAKNWSSLCSNAAVASGVCCCGDSMDGHASPMSCGHSPCDSGEYYAYQLSEETDKCLATTPGDLSALREVCAKVLEEAEQVYSAEQLRSGEWTPEVLK